ncbi:unnamed protein product, partial [Iphiclides podalirius]
MAVSYPVMSTVAKRNASAPLAAKSRNYGAGALRQSREATLFGGRRQVKTCHGTVLRFTQEANKTRLVIDAQRAKFNGNAVRK